MIVLYDPRTLLHDTIELLGAKTRPALESPDRIKEIVAKISGSNHQLQYIELPLGHDPALSDLLDIIGQTHDAKYLHHLQNVFSQWRAAGLIEAKETVLPECFVFPNSAHKKAHPPSDIYARAGFFAFDMSTGIMEHTYTSTIASANLAYHAVKILVDKRVLAVFALCRPPGHHCDGQRAGGYCYVNNASVAITSWRKHMPDARIGILDIDFHHGNGTQEMYYADPNVFYTSVHGEGEFPYYTGMAEEVGVGDAVGTNLNLPLETGSSFELYLTKLDVALSALKSFGLDFLLVSLGFDTFHLDPLGNFKIGTEDYETMAGRIRKCLPNIPSVIILEGGYVLEHLGTNALSFLRGWEMQST